MATSAMVKYLVDMHYDRNEYREFMKRFKEWMKSEIRNEENK
jgi:hypothetical protein